MLQEELAFGGVVGFAFTSEVLEDTVNSCYNIGSISGTNSVGGIVGLLRPRNEYK